VLNEILIRFNDRDIRFRYTAMVLAQWTVVASFQIMLGFATRHGAGKMKFDLRLLFTPIYCCFIFLLIMGFNKKYGAYCSPNPYPKIFFVQTVFFFLLYFLFRIMKRYHYFIEWQHTPGHEHTERLKNLVSVALNQEEEEEGWTAKTEEDSSDRQTRHSRNSFNLALQFKQLKAEMVFYAQTKRFECFYDFLIIIYCIMVTVSTSLMVLVPGGVVGCTEDGSHWLFKDCNSLLLMYMVHTITTMQTASMCRNVFIKTINDVKKTDDYIAATEIESKLHSQCNDLITPRTLRDNL